MLLEKNISFLVTFALINCPEVGRVNFSQVGAKISSIFLKIFYGIEVINELYYENSATEMEIK